jgi:hypothetical protein
VQLAVAHNLRVANYLNLFSPAAYEAFSKSDRTVSGFQEKHQSLAKRVKPGDTFLCYVTKLSRWLGAFTVVDGPFTDRTPIYGPDDPFIVRFSRYARHLALDRESDPDQGG